MRGIDVRQLTAKDAVVLRGLMTVFAEAFEDPATYLHSQPSDTYLQALLGNEHFISLVALHAGAVVAGLTAYELKKFEQERSEIYIYDLAVAAAHRRKGIATDLIERLKSIASTRGGFTIFVQSDLDDLPAIALYSKLGVRQNVLHFDIPPLTP